MARFSASKKKTVAKVRYSRTTPKPVTQVHQSVKVKNLAGGVAFTMDKKVELVILMTTDFLDEKFHESGGERLQRLQALVKEDPHFAAQASVYVRHQHGNRSITHVVAAIVAHEVKGESWTKDFFNANVRRVDDVIETLCAYLKLYGKPIPNSLKKGLGSALGRFDEYGFAKYKFEDRELSLVDVVNLIHPTPTNKNREALRQLIKGELKNTETWEAKLSAAGSDPVAKERVWTEMIREDELGYFALLKNLRNIAQQAPNAIPLALQYLTDPAKIKQSLVMPFRFTNAYEQLQGLTAEQQAGQVLAAVERACEIATSNVPTFPGKLCVVVDDSGSMFNSFDKRSISAATHAALFTAVLMKANPAADFVCFNSAARYVTVNPKLSLIQLRNEISGKFSSGGTDFESIFRTLNKKYDRIIILSDMQGWQEQGSNPVKNVYEAYCRRYNTRPKLYSFDLAGHGTTKLPAADVFCLAGFSDKVFDTMRVLELDKNALVNEVQLITFTPYQPKK